MIISKQKLDHQVVPKLMCNGDEIELVFEFKYLGVIFDSTFNFNCHFNNVVKRLASAVGCLIFLKRFLN